MPTPLLCALTLGAQMVQKHADAADAAKELATPASKPVPVKSTAAQAAGVDVPSPSGQSVEAPACPDGSAASLAERKRAVTAELEHAELAHAILVAEIDAIAQRKQNVESKLTTGKLLKRATEAATIVASEMQQECATFMRLREGEGTERYGSSKVKMNVTNEEFFGVW